MTFFFRKVKDNLDWRNPAPKEFPWLQEGEIQSDPVTHIKSQENSISLYEISGGQIQAPRVIAALAAGCQGFDKVDFVIFRKEILEGHGFNIEDKPGTTPDEQVNRWHRNLVFLSANKIVHFAALVIRDSQTILGRELSPTVQELVEEGIKRGELDLKKVNKGLRAKLAKG